MSRAMTDIKRSSDEVGKIIKVIEEIAFQTNILSLNAAVEAARAGDAGRGFAVVAEEVRSLAKRCATATQDSALRIEAAVKSAEVGVRTGERVSAALGQINTAVRNVNHLVEQIAAASEEQARGIEQVNTAIRQADKVVQENAATSEETAATAEEISAQSRALQTTADHLARLTGITVSGDESARPSFNDMRPALAAKA
jgi:methyl-accepting chemotaxis protein